MLKFNQFVNEEVLDENVYKQMAAANKARIKAEKEKAKADLKSAHAEHAVAKKKHKEEIDHWTARVVNAEVGAHYPDTDGWDAIHKHMKKIGLHDAYDAHEHVSRVVRKHLGAKSFGDYVDKFHADYKRDNG